jgi:hypothetical protein
MPTSPNNLLYIENGLLRRLAPDEQLVFDARLLVDEALRSDFKPFMQPLLPLPANNCVPK